MHFPGHELSPNDSSAAPFAPPPFVTVWVPPSLVHEATATPETLTVPGMATGASHMALAELGWQWTRLLVRDLSGRVAQTAAAFTHTPSAPPATSTLKPQNSTVEQAIRLDAEVAAFVASTWGADMSPRDHLDVLLARLQRLGRLDVSITQLVEQTRWLREITKTLIEHEEHLLDQERAQVERQHQQSARTMEWAVGVLAFLGLPLGIAAELHASGKLTFPYDNLIILGVGIVLPFSIGVGMIATAVVSRMQRRRDKRQATQQNTTTSSGPSPEH